MWDQLSLRQVNDAAHREWLVKCILEQLKQGGVRMSDENRRKTEAFVRELLPHELPPIY